MCLFLVDVRWGVIDVAQAMLQCRALPALMFLGLAPTMAAFIPVRTTPFACLPPQTLSRTEPRRVFDVALRKPMGLILEELPGRVFVASIATSGSAAIARGAVLPGDRIIAVQGVACEDDDLAGVMERIGAVDSSDVSMRFSRDASVCAVSFESGSVVAGRSGEPLRDVAARAGHAVSYDCETGR